MAQRGANRKPEVRRRILLVGVLLAAALTTARAFQLGVLEGERWRARALDQQGDTLTLTAPRGTIYDRDGVPLAASHEVYSVMTAPLEMGDRREVAALLRRHLGMSRAAADKSVDPSRRWVVLPGRYGSEVREALDGVPGIHFESVLQRFYPNGSIARELLGPVRLDGVALGGLELELDTILSGRAGRAVVRRDSRGRPLPGAMVRAIEPTPGRDVYLTIDYDLQEIADQALGAALAEANAAGGELLLTDPQTGEVLAAVSRGRDQRARNWTGVTQPYEPGSTLKPFTAAALLGLRRATLADSVWAEEGRYEELRLTDVHGHGWLTLADALRFSSNIGLAKLGARLTPAEHYVSLRDFGFGSPTGVSYPSESAGRLPPPARWSRTSSSRLSIGYEISATPLQMAMAYGALANGGELLLPRLVREVRSRDGRVENSVPRQVVRRVIPKEVAAALRDVLIGAVQDGTGQGAGLGSFTVAGKTGTARIAGNGGYIAGAYTASFAGYFPAHDPQLVIIVKVDEPRGAYYGGATAAPVTRATLEAALAAHSTPIDVRPIARAARPVRTATDPTQRRAAVHHAGPVASPVAGPMERVQLTRAASSAQHAAPARVDGRAAAAAGDGAMEAAAVPDVSGMPLRDGVRRLHAAGYRIRVEGRGRVTRTIPSAGAATESGAVVRVIGEVSS